MISLLATFKVKKKDLSKVKRAIQVFVSQVCKKEKETLLYKSFQLSDTFSFVHAMTFKNKKAQNHHQQTEHVQQFVKVLYPCCTKKPRFTKIKEIYG